jgi:hypothetical protein
MRIAKILIVCLLAFQSSCATARTKASPCSDPKVQSERSLELQAIQVQDQADRECYKDLSSGARPDQATLEKMAENDLTRRIQVGKIFGEGCLKSAADYKAAFIVYQHGNTSDQFFQAFIWASEAFKLGDISAKSDIAMSIDRYLVSTGHKELFGTQATQSENGGCWCIQAIEDSFSQALRDDYRGGLNADYTGLKYLKVLNKNKNCPASYCDTKLLPSPRGTVLGFW